MNPMLHIITLLVAAIVVVIAVPTIVAGLSWDSPSYVWIVNDYNNLNNQGNFLKDGVVKQTSLYVETFLVDNTTLTLTHYFIQDGATFKDSWVEVSIPLEQANLRKIR